jgi:calcium-dependent protein kinase
MESKNSNRIKIIDLGLSEIVEKSSSLKSERGSIYYLAPEMILKNYNYKVDIWSSGIIFFVLLTGKPPFNAVKRDVTGTKHLDTKKIKKLILEGNVSYEHRVFQNEGQILKELIQIMLHPDPNHRPEAKDLLKHPFFKKEVNLDISDMGMIIMLFEVLYFNFRNEKDFQKFMRFQQWVNTEKWNCDVFCKLFRPTGGKKEIPKILQAP